MIERSVPILPTEDLESAKLFYVNGLGFAVTFSASEDGHTGIMGLKRGTIALTLDSPMDGHGRKACAALEVDDADRYFAEWRGRIAIEDSPKDEPWGARTFSVEDPSGNTLFVIGPGTRA